MADAPLEIHPTAYVSPDARLHPSQRGTRIVIGAHSEIYDYVVIRAVGGTGDIVIGAHCYINPHCTLYSGSGIRFGDYVLVGPGCSIVPANHGIARLDVPIRKQGFMPSRGGVVVEDDVWIGANCVILDGAHIETGAVVAAGSVVTGRLTARAVWGGNPCRLIRERAGPR
ncbi:MAG TPA: DapH/DapD/GlmU-related protein [Usitatibacter sp.]|jgi:acetyltransferase-like isoleucine patch superfamily enzyme